MNNVYADPAEMANTSLASSVARTPYDGQFFDSIQAGSLSSAQIIVPLVVDLVQPKSVVDVGCGIGTWLKAFVDAGVEDLLGLDGDYVKKDQLMIDPKYFQSVDLRHPQALNRRYDLAVCLEVGEHLPAASAPKLVAMLTTASPCVLFSAALPGQGGTHHINEQWPQFWKRLFESHGYVRLDPIRHRIWREPLVEWWYKQNVYLFCHSSQIDLNPLLRHEAELATSCSFELLYTDVLGPLTTLRGLALSFAAAVPRAAKRLCRRVINSLLV